jgi:hypothetical protein
LVKSERPNFSSGTKVQITVGRTLPPTDRPTTSSAQIFASLVFDLFHFTPSSPISARAFSTSSPNQDIRF